MQPIEFLRATPPFDHLDPAELERVAQQLKIVRYPAETRILEQGGEPSHFLYLIREGAVRLERDGRTVLVMEEGEMFGFPSMLGRTAPVMDVVTEEPTLVYQIHESLFRELLQNSAFAAYFLEGLSERLRRTAETPRPGALVWGDLAQPVHHLVQRPAVWVGADATVAQAAQVMHEHNISSVLVDAEPPGIVTVRDLRSRVLAQGRLPDTPVTEVMSAPLRVVPADLSIFQAMLVVLQEGIHHLPLEQDGRIVGVITDGDLLRHQVRNPLFLLERIRHLGDPEQLATYAQEVAGAVAMLHRSGLEVAQIGRVVAGLNDSLTQRLLRLAEEELGPPPVPYAWIVFGSEGRMEQTLLTDQDNALIYAEASPQADIYFANLAARVVQQLIQAGFPPCPGGYSADHWHRPLAEWVALFRTWIESPTPQALLEAGIFFDFRKVHGDLDLAPLEQLLDRQGRRPMFLAHMARAALAWRPPLGFLRRIRAEKGQVDLKRSGIGPIVSMARVYALEAGTDSRPTLDRLRAAADAGILSRQGMETLSEAFRFLLRIRLDAQLAQLEAGETPSNAVTLDALPPLERSYLKECFVAIQEMQDALALRYQTDMLG